ncbi:PLP-dependent aminotransferase family protein [Kordiimonas marina]|uniref:aminotransferase-like domain-containing protein n=1 Tax=Kordiimonas marina TaxID=2872312 RepID=UPI001FF51D08|nr:PLP-dependent aminotransferase family protein [Kordiimonas marina]MCJ9429324.1 PLP-dependent aminotransferase family protein [Kordiimonas marina]
MWKPRLANSARIKYLGIVDALQEDIQSGRVVGGDRLPPQRTIAEALDVDLTTVTRAFNEARRRGLIDAQAGRGTFVSPAMEGDEADVLGDISYDLSMNMPPQPAEANLSQAITSAITSILRSPRGAASMHYRESIGTEKDRQAGTIWLAKRIEGIGSNRVLVSAGAQSALFAICELNLRRGQVIAAGSMTYPGLKAVASQKGLIVEALTMDEHGIMPDAFEQVCRERSPKALYVIPTIDNPTTVTMPEERRRTIAALARRYNVAIIEDDPYAPLRPERLTTFTEMAADITWHIATLSKCVTPALRVAYVVAPTGADALRLATAMRATTLMAPPLMSSVATRWVLDGSLDRITGAIRAENMKRQLIAKSVLGNVSMAADPCGHHIWLQLPGHWRASDFSQYADRAGILIVPSATFATGDDQEEAVRISLGVAPDRETVKDGLSQLASLMSQPSHVARTIV